MNFCSPTAIPQAERFYQVTSELTWLSFTPFSFVLRRSAFVVTERNKGISQSASELTAYLTSRISWGFTKRMSKAIINLEIGCRLDVSACDSTKRSAAVPALTKIRRRFRGLSEREQHYYFRRSFFCMAMQIHFKRICANHCWLASDTREMRPTRKRRSLFGEKVCYLRKYEDKATRADVYQDNFQCSLLPFRRWEASVILQRKRKWSSQFLSGISDCTGTKLRRYTFV